MRVCVYHPFTFWEFNLSFVQLFPMFFPIEASVAPYALSSLWKIFASSGKARLNLKSWKCPSSKAWTNLWTKAKSQKIVSQGYFILYNTPFSFKSSAWDLSPVAVDFGLCSERRVFLPPRRIETHDPRAYSCSPNAKLNVFIVFLSDF